MKIKERLIAALDTSSAEKVKDSAENLRGVVGLFSVGLPLLLTEGMKVIDSIQHKILLDLRLGDAASAVESIACQMDNRVKFLTVSPFIGREALVKLTSRINIITEVIIATPSTVLTDYDLKFIKCSDRQAYESTLKIVKDALALRVSGVLCTPEEVAYLREELGTGPTIICNKIGLLGSMVAEKDEATPFAEMYNGADFVVAGKMLSFHYKPEDMARMIADRMSAGYDARKRLTE